MIHWKGIHKKLLSQNNKVNNHLSYGVFVSETRNREVVRTLIEHLVDTGTVEDEIEVEQVLLGRRFESPVERLPAGYKKVRCLLQYSLLSQRRFSIECFVQLVFHHPQSLFSMCQGLIFGSIERRVLE